MPPVGAGVLPSGSIVKGTTKPGLLVAVGKNEAEGWRIALIGGGAVFAILTPAEAQGLAKDLTAMSAVCKGQWGD